MTYRMASALTPDMPRGDNPILRFAGEHEFLSNFAEAPVAMKGILYPTVEHAFQAMKSLDREVQRNMAGVPTPTGAKRYGRRLKLRPDWEQVKDLVMLSCLRAKFASNPELGVQLSQTEGRWLEEGNDWGDRYWGTVDGHGQNRLGLYLMRVRAERAVADPPLLVDGLDGLP